MPPESNGRSAIRDYVILEQRSDEEGPYYVAVLTVPARNATNALRAAFRQLAPDRERADGGDHEAVLVVVPASMWRPTPVRAKVQSRVSVSVG